MTRVGPAGWSYKDWRGVVYPSKRPRSFHELAFLSRFYDTVEINVSFYRPLTPTETETWVHHVAANSRFRFTAKLWRPFTHQRTATTLDVQAVKKGFLPLVEAGRLGALLFQFPWSYRNTPENRAYFARIREFFDEYPVILEIRHASWATAETLSWLESISAGLCNIDQPLFRRSIEPSALLTTSLGYIRLHGRNYKSWFAENKFPGERYNYLYSADELSPWVDRIRTLEATAQDTYVITNNHYLGKALVNASEISSILRGEMVTAPADLLKHYPELANFAQTADGDGQLSLISEE